RPRPARRCRRRRSPPWAWGNGPLVFPVRSFRRDEHQAMASNIVAIGTSSRPRSLLSPILRMGRTTDLGSVRERGQTPRRLGASPVWRSDSYRVLESQKFRAKWNCYPVKNCVYVEVPDEVLPLVPTHRRWSPWNSVGLPS